MIGSYIGRLEAGEDISRPHAAVVAERDRITAEHRASSPRSMRAAFDQQLALARTVFPYVENHDFYVDHWYHTIFWNKVREFGALLAAARLPRRRGGRLLPAPRRGPRSALEELRLDWSSGGAGAARGPAHWPPIVERRKPIHEAMREWAPPPALGLAPEEITEPVAIMLWGITTERIQEWLDLRRRRRRTR